MFTLFLVAALFGPYQAETIRVLDGDTVEVRTEVYPQVFVKTKIRLRGVNAPETRTRDLCEKAAGLDAKSFVKNLLPVGKVVTINEIAYGKFAGRVLGEIIIDGQKLTDILLLHKKALPYNGGKREPWCK